VEREIEIHFSPILGVRGNLNYHFSWYSEVIEKLQNQMYLELSFEELKTLSLF